jgi:cysteine-S-conjugate beta-lyase
MVRLMGVTQAAPMDTLRRRRSEKWTTYPADVLPMFVAEMDFPLAPAIQQILVEAVDLGDTGYIGPNNHGVCDAFSVFARDRWGWSPSPDRMVTTTDVSVVIVESLRLLTSPGDGVIITPPVYPPFFEFPVEAGARVVEVPLLHETGAGWELDLDGIDRALAAGARGVLLCSPHNPLGLVHSRESLVELSRVVARHGGFVLSDEIHAPLTFSNREFVPYLTVSAEAAEHGLAAESVSKAFDLAGLKCAFFVAESDPMTELIRRLPGEVSARTGLFGLLATRAGLESGRDWLDATVAAIEQNVEVLATELDRHLPGVRFDRPDASYLAWLDLSGLGWGDDPAEIALSRARVALSSGLAFGSPGSGHARMNLACAPETIVDAVDRLARAARERASR